MARHRGRRQLVPAARTTLRRAQIILILAFTVTNAVGLSLFAWLAIRLDAENGVERLDSELDLTTVSVIQHLDFKGRYGSIQFDQFLTRRPAANSCFVVLPGSAPQFKGQEFYGDDCIVPSLRTMNQLATLATLRGTTTSRTVSDGRGHLLRVLAEPFGSERAQAAVVASVDADPVIGQHRQKVLTITIGCAVVIVGLALTAHLVTARAMRPAVNTLDQQELFLAESAHDLRTPVAALRAITETAMDNADQRGVLLPRAVALTQRMSDIIDDLLVRARLASGVEQLNLQPVRLDQLVAGIVEDLPANGEAEVYLTTEASTIAADYPLLRRAIGNLIDNARKYGRRPGEQAFVEVDVRDGRVIVADHGPGMHTAMSSTPFARRDRSSPDSTGLGLPIVRWVAEAHKGKLRVYNRPDGGAVFELTLPPI